MNYDPSKIVAQSADTIYLDDDADFADVNIPTENQRIVVVDNSKNNELRIEEEAAMERQEETRKDEEIIANLLKWEDEPAKVEDIEITTETPLTDSILELVKNSSQKVEKEKEEITESLADIIDFSDVFSNEEKINYAIPEKDVITKRQAKKVDISKLSIVSRNELEKERDLKTALFGNKAAFQIIAAQSGYSAKVIPLVNKDIFNIINVSLSRYEYRKEVYKIIYQKIIDMSCGKVDFDTFLQMTSTEDAETFYYALYCSTFQNTGSLSFACPYCGEEHTYQVSNNSLVTTANTEEVKKLMSDIRANVKNFDDVGEYTLIGKNEAFQLSESGIICDVRTPSLWDTLELLRTTSEEVIDRDSMSVTNMLYINKMLIPSRDNENRYSEETDRARILKTIDNLSVDDSSELQNAISERLDRHRITYSIKNLVCPNPKCQKTVSEVPVSLEDLLFTAIYEKMN